MDYMSSAMDRQYEAWMEQEREWYETVEQFTQEGWHHGILDKVLNQPELNEIYKWLNENYFGQHEIYNNEVLLPTARDLNWFMLRWS